MNDPTATASATSPAAGARAPRPVYAITERDARSLWTRIGSAWNNRDGSITIRLDALPVSGVLQVRDPDERHDGRGGNP